MRESQGFSMIKERDEFVECCGQAGISDAPAVGQFFT